MSKLNVFDYNNLIKQVQQKNLDPETLKDTLQSLEGPRNLILDNVATWVEENQAEQDWLTKKKRALADLDFQLKKQTTSLQEFLTKAIDDSGKKEITTSHHILKPRNYRDSVIVEDAKKIPVDYVVTTESIRPNKQKLYKDLKAGKEIKGAYLKKNRKTVIE